MERRLNSIFYIVRSMACRSLLKDSQIDASKWAWKLLQTPEQPDNMSCGVYMLKVWHKGGWPKVGQKLHMYCGFIKLILLPWRRLTKYDRKHDHCYRSMHAVKVSGIWSELWRFSNSLHSSDFVLPSFRPCKKKELVSVLFSEILWSEGRFFYFYYFLFSSRSFDAKIQ